MSDLSADSRHDNELDAVQLGAKTRLLGVLDLHHLLFAAGENF